MKPLSPDELQNPEFPDSVIKIINTAIKTRFQRGEAVLYQAHLAQIMTNVLNISRSDVFANGYMDFEQLYRDQGWIVEYHSPDRDETWKALFIFKKKEENDNI